MKTIRRQRLVAIFLLFSGVALAMTIALYALRQNINLFFTPSSLVNVASETLYDKAIRLGGMVEKNSVKRKEGLKVSFWVTDTHHRILVEYQGILPDLFREGQGIVTLGHLTKQGTFIAEEVLAKHDENYMPPLPSDVNMNTNDASKKI